MKILNTLLMAIAVCSGMASANVTPCNHTYTQTINPETITWEQIDPSVRKFFIKSVAYGIEHSSEIMTEPDAMAIIIKTIELSLNVDFSDLSGEYKAYQEASLPIIKSILEDLKKAPPIPLPTSMDEMPQYQQALINTILKARNKHQSEYDELKRKYPNAVALFETSQPGISQPKIMELFAAKYNVQQMTIANLMTSSSHEEAIRKTAQQLYALAEEQK